MKLSKSHNVLFVVERLLPSHEGVQFLPGDTEIRGHGICGDLFWQHGGSFREIFVDHLVVLTVSSKYMFNLVAQDEPEIIDSITLQRHTNNRCPVDPKADSVNPCPR